MSKFYAISQKNNFYFSKAYGSGMSYFFERIYMFYPDKLDSEIFHLSCMPKNQRISKQEKVLKELY